MNHTTSNWRTRIGAILGPTDNQNFGIDRQDQVQHVPTEAILIVDDDAAWGEECAFTLQTLGYVPLIAENAEDALRLFESQDVSIAVVDYNMPGQDGISLIHTLTRLAEEQGRRLHFIMATGYATKDIAVGAMRASAVDFLEKPVDQSDLRKALQRIKGLRDTPAAREVLLGKLSNLSSELQRLTQLIDEPDKEPIPPQERLREISDGPRLYPERDSASELTGFIRELLRKEATRRSIGGGALFGDPTWEMLLDLLLANIENREVSVSSACIASGAPMSTALRLVRRLVAEDVLCRIPDNNDRRRNFLIINPKFERPLVDHLLEQLQQRTANG